MAWYSFIPTLTLVSLLSSIGHASDEVKVYQYSFSWGLIPIAKLEIDFSEYKSDGLVFSKGNSRPLKLLKNYKAKAVLQERLDNSLIVYRLLGSDRGVEEVRSITFKKWRTTQCNRFQR